MDETKRITIGVDPGSREFTSIVLKRGTQFAWMSWQNFPPTLLDLYPCQRRVLVKPRAQGISRLYFTNGSSFVAPAEWVEKPKPPQELTEALVVWREEKKRVTKVALSLVLQPRQESDQPRLPRSDWGGFR